jgi:hypothetical protein
MRVWKIHLIKHRDLIRERFHVVKVKDNFITAMIKNGVLPQSKARDLV